jgi:hypothetical protein
VKPEMSSAAGLCVTVVIKYFKIVCSSPPFSTYFPVKNVTCRVHLVAFLEVYWGEN